jgi:hypothetical protein
VTVLDCGDMRKGWISRMYIETQMTDEVSTRERCTQVMHSRRVFCSQCKKESNIGVTSGYVMTAKPRVETPDLKAGVPVLSLSEV